MTTLKGKARLLATATLLIVASSFAQAATDSVSWTNVGDTNYIFLFAETPFGLEPLTFDNVSFSAASSGWTLNELQPVTAIFSGAEVAAGSGGFTLDFSYWWNNTAIQWAEVLFDAGDYSYTIENSGRAAHNVPWFGGGAASWSYTNAFSGANQAAIGDYFASVSPAAVPVPSSVVLMLSAAAFMGFSRRARADAVATTA
jgi:hypothetical protein